ncbi:MAG: aldehyde dehydrogenase family protein [Candidatus Methanofastidiosa archaeon]|nr:aldehyde dehydrogenase family protein [Candidatus Methanofastidiosa archaeon]
MKRFLKELGIEDINPGGSYGIDRWVGSGDTVTSINPSDGEPIAKVQLVTTEEYEKIVDASVRAFKAWRLEPAPKRGEIVREIGLKLRERKEGLGRLITLEMGKILEEGKGEVQEAIDMSDFACGLSRQLYGLTMASERPNHRMYEQWHPLGPIGIITSFNFPMAVWGWNALVSLVCGDTPVWKPSTKVPLCAIAIQKACNEVLCEHGWEEGVSCLVCGTGREVGDLMTKDARLPLISATGSVAMGRKVSVSVAERLGRSILELGGNNALIVSEKADLDVLMPALVFGAIGTAGQRCTTIRRVIVHEEIKEILISRLIKAYSSLRIGDPMDKETVMGPLVDPQAVANMQGAVQTALEQGGTLLHGGRRISGNFVEPAIIEMPGNVPIVCTETFAPILYVIPYDDFDEALALHNDVPQGLSSGIFSKDLEEVERFLSVEGSDCGIANVNISTSGAEIGGAFGGEKDTGGGREAGSDAWKAYMRRQTVTINWGRKAQLSQGIDFS